MTNVIVVTTQFPGLTSAGGIAKPAQALALNLASAGVGVSVVLTRVEQPPTSQMRDDYAEQGVGLVYVPQAHGGVFPWWLEAHSRITGAVRDLDPDLVIAQEWHGLAALTAGQGWPRVPVVSWLHGGTMYDHFGSGRYFPSYYSFLDSELERVQSERATLLVSPSQFLIDWYAKMGWRLQGEKCSVIPNFVSATDVQESHRALLDRPLAVAFVGQLSMRKGLDRFLEAVSDEAVKRLGLPVFIFGREIDYSSQEIVERLQSHGIQAIVRTDADSRGVWEALSAYRCALLLPSRLDNSPGVALEAASRGHHVFAWNGSGTLELRVSFPEQIHPWKDWNDALAQLSKDVDPGPLVDGHNSRALERWLEVIAAAESTRVGRPTKVENCEDSVSVIVPTHLRASALEAAIESITLQSYQGIREIIVSDDAGDSETQVVVDRWSARDSRVKYIEASSAQGPGASRNLAAKVAVGAWLAFCDDDNLWHADHLRDLLSAAHACGSKLVVSTLAEVQTDAFLRGCDWSRSERDVIFTGSLLPGVGVLENVVGDSHCLVDTAYFWDLGGFSEEWPSSQEDWDLLLRAIARGDLVSFLATPTVLYRKNSSGVQASMTTAESWHRMDRSVEGSSPFRGYVTAARLVAHNRDVTGSLQHYARTQLAIALREMRRGQYAEVVAKIRRLWLESGPTQAGGSARQRLRRYLGRP